MQNIRLHYRPVRYLATRFGARVRPSMGFGPLGFVSLDDSAPPEPHGREWLRLRPLLSGICGSDLAAVTGHDSFMLEPFAAFPFTLGHEIVAEVVTAPDATPHRPGDRVIVNPILACRQRGITPVCPACARGETGLCRNFDQGPLGAGFSTGYCPTVGGGWGEELVAHASQLHPAEGLDDRVAVLTDPFVSALRPVLLHPPAGDDVVLVVGAGTIGLLTIRALRATGWQGEVAVAARYPFQRELARAAGASTVLEDRDDVWEWARALPESRAYDPSFAPRFVEGGPSLVYDTVGSERTIQDALTLTREDGRVVLVGSAARVAADFTRVWYRQLTLAGVIAYGDAPFHGERRDIYDVALELIRDGGLDALPLVTHVFPLAEYRAALSTALSKGASGAVKVAFRPGS